MIDYKNYFYSIRDLNLQEEKELCFWFSNNIFGYKEREEEIWENFYPLYKKLSPEKIYEFRKSYGFCFGLLSWSLFNSLKREEIYDVVSLSSFLGFLQGEDVWYKMLTYLKIRAIDEKDVNEIYFNLKNRFLHSREIIDIDQNGVSLTLSNFLEKVNLFLTREDSLGLSDFLLVVENKIKKRLDEVEIKDPGVKDVLIGLRSLLEFFMGISQEKFYNFFYSLNNPRKFEIIYNRILKKKGLLSLVNQDKKNNEDAPFMTAFDNTNSKFQRVNYQSIKNSIENFYKKDEDGNFVDLPEILNKIMELSDKYNDPKIKDLYYFDEQKGEFIWNEDLL